jgi:hypothetical protein
MIKQEIMKLGEKILIIGFVASESFPAFLRDSGFPAQNIAFPVVKLSPFKASN